MPKPLFDELSSARLEKALAVMRERGGQYGDTLRNSRWLKTLAVAKELGFDMNASEARALVAAGLGDIKYDRFEGGYKEDHFDDGINYDSVTPGLVELAKQSRSGYSISLNTIPVGTEMPMGVTAADIQKLKQEDWRDSSHAPLLISFSVRTNGETGRAIKIRQDGSRSQWEGSYEDGTEVFEPEEYDANSGRAIGEKQ